MYNKNVKATEVQHFEEIVNLIKRNKKFLVCCDSKTTAESIYLKCKDEEIELGQTELISSPEFSGETTQLSSLSYTYRHLDERNMELQCKDFDLTEMESIKTVLIKCILKKLNTLRPE